MGSCGSKLTAPRRDIVGGPSNRPVADHDSHRHPRITAAQREIPGGGTKPPSGRGSKPLTFHHPDLLKALEQLVDPVARGDPESFLRWTAKSTRKLAAELQMRAG